MDNINNEIWTPAIYIQFDGTKVDFSGIYEVSNYGRIKSLGNSKTKKEKILKTFVNLNGYKVIDLKINCVRFSCQVHRLIMSSFFPDKWFDGAVCNHKDECRINNNLDNLEWLSIGDNNSYGNRLKRCSDTQKKRSTLLKIQQAKISSIPVIELDSFGNTISNYNSLNDFIKQLDLDNTCCIYIQKKAV